MIDSKQLLSDLQKQVRLLEDDLRKRCNTDPEVDAPLRREYEQAKTRKRTALTYQAWRDGELTQVAVAWVLGCVFVRFLEDNELLNTPKLSGPGDRLSRARDEHELFFRQRPTDTEREYLHEVFEDVGKLPAMREFFDRKHNPLWLAAPSGDACRELWQFWQKTDPETGDLVHDFTDPDWNTRFLGDLYQDLSEAARKRYALLQTPDFVEEFILDRTLTPAIETFGYREVRLIDPTCGSGHFLLSAFARLFRIWQEEEPGENPRVLVQRALDGVCGVDLNPFAVAIARFRLLLAALWVCDVKRLKDAPDFRIHLAVGDSLLHGARFSRLGDKVTAGRQQTFGGEEELFKDELAHFYDTEDAEELHRILGQQYHAVVGNPPYITVKDKALNHLYRARYESCHRQYALSVPFMERFFDLALSGSNDGRKLAGFTGQITANSFMKREFGKKLVEEHIPHWEFTHVIDSDKAFIPGHATPTIIIFGRNSKPTKPSVRTVMGIKKEIPAPAKPALGRAWLAIVDQIDNPGFESEFVSIANTDRKNFYSHPWSLAGGGAAELKNLLETSSGLKLSKWCSDLGARLLTRLDDAFELPIFVGTRLRFSENDIREFGVGENVRDWGLQIENHIAFPYDTNHKPSAGVELLRYLWAYRTDLRRRVAFGKTQIQHGKEWYEYSMFFKKRMNDDTALLFSDVSTSNHFVVDRSVTPTNSHAPALFLKDSNKEEIIPLCGLLNSSLACFWMKQVSHDKGAGGIGGGIASEQWEHRYEFDGTKLKQFPLPSGSPSTLSRYLDCQAQGLAKRSPDNLAANEIAFSSKLAEAEQQATNLRARMISLQEELDWQCYRHYGLIDVVNDLEWPEDQLETLPPLNLGERSFEIHMARQMAAGELETTWFERHKDAGSEPITVLPDHWPDDYRALVERRLAFIESNKNINLIERPEYKRRWNTEPWSKRQKEALRKWLLARLEGYFFEGSRVCGFKDTFDPASHGFTTATRPHLASANQLADVVQSDPKFLEAAEVYEGTSGFSVPKLIRTLVGSESVPFLPIQRYKDSGLRKRRDWEATWNLQRMEDVIEAKVRHEHTGRTEVELKALVRKEQQKQVGDIPVPPKYVSKDFAKTSYWKLRGKLDVPKERWISYPGAESAGDSSLLIAWAGWDHLQQAQALSEYFLDAKDNQGWSPEKLNPLLAGLADLIPWLKQWHNEYDSAYGMGLGDYFAGFLGEQCRTLDTTVEEVEKARFEYSSQEQLI